MTFADIISLVLLVTIPLGAAGLAYGLVRNGWPVLAWGWTGGLVAAAGVVLYLSGTAGEADRLATVVIGRGLLLIAVCAGVGAGLGAGLRMWRRRKK